MSWLSGLQSSVNVVNNLSQQIQRIARGPTSSIESHIPDSHDQFNGSVLLSIAGGLPLVGVPATVGAKAIGLDTDWRISLATMGATSAALHLFAPRTAAALFEFSMLQGMRGAGFYPTLGTGSAGIAGSGVAWRVPTWAIVAIYAHYVHTAGKPVIASRKYTGEGEDAKIKRKQRKQFA